MVAGPGRDLNPACRQPRRWWMLGAALPMVPPQPRAVGSAVEALNRRGDGPAGGCLFVTDLTREGALLEPAPPLDCSSPALTTGEGRRQAVPGRALRWVAPEGASGWLLARAFEARWRIIPKLG
jgi:hypothetical protein